ncbi:MAG: MarR family transcriptional regulator [Ruminococcaceae bacterium]|nr:MarR family transcriptional regulator [Oscillospiraceae bacterium]
MKTHTMFHREVMAETARFGLTAGQPKVLECLAKFGERDQKSIAAYCEIEQATAGSIITRMEEGGLVARRQKPGNRRSLYVSLTPAGQAAAQSVLQVFESIEARALRGIPKSEASQLVYLLQTLCDNMAGPAQATRGASR